MVIIDLNIFQGRCLESAIIFSVLLNLKHIFMYVSPAYFVFLLRNYCFDGKTISINSRCMKNSLKLGSMVVIVFLLSFGPFIYHGQLSQVLFAISVYNIYLQYCFLISTFCNRFYLVCFRLNAV